jgi:hypothetical protein
MHDSLLVYAHFTVSFVIPSGSPAPAAPQTNPQKPPLGRPRPGQPPPPFEQPSPQQQKPYSVQQLAFSPALDVSVLRQVLL